MTSKFATGTNRRNSPAWCKPGMFTGINPMHDGRPTGITAYARWQGTDSGGPYNVIETFRLTRTTAADGYDGFSSIFADNLQMILTDTADIAIYDLELIIRLDQSPRQSTTWPSIDITQRPPWGTQLLRKRGEGLIQIAEVQILA